MIYATPAGAVLAVSLLLNGFLGSYFQQRILVSSVGLFIAILGVLLITLLPLENSVGHLAGYFVAYTMSMPIVALLSIISSNVAGYTKKTTVAALYLMCYCAANITGKSCHQSPISVEETLTSLQALKLSALKMPRSIDLPKLRCLSVGVSVFWIYFSFGGI